MAKKFFENLDGIKTNKIIPNIYLIIDWLFDDKKFENEKWDKNKGTKFTKMIKKRYFNNKNYVYDSIGKLNLNKTYKSLYIIMSNGNSEYRDLTRHIRNGIAHSNAELKNKSGEIWFYIEDYSKKSEKTSKMSLTYEFLEFIYNTYKELLKQKYHKKNKRR